MRYGCTEKLGLHVVGNPVGNADLGTYMHNCRGEKVLCGGANKQALLPFIFIRTNMDTEPIGDSKAKD